MKKSCPLRLFCYPALMAFTALLALTWPAVALRAARSADQPVLAIRLNYASTDALLTMLTSAGITAGRPQTPVRVEVDEAAHLVMLWGPPDDLARVDQIARALEQVARERVPTAIRLIKLHATRAADQTVFIAGRPTVLPGIATRLRQQFASRRPFAAKVARLGIVPTEYEVPLPIIEADPRTNSVLIRDRPEKLDTDTALIAGLDIKPEVVRINAAVANIDVDALATWSLPWQSADAISRFALINDVRDGVALVAQLKQFAAEGRAQVEFERSALTVDRTPALIGRYEDRLVQAANAGEEALLDLSSGVALNVTPVLSGPPDRPLITLLAQFSVPGATGTESAQMTEVRVEVAPSQGALIATPVAAPPPSQSPPNSKSSAFHPAAPPSRVRIVLLFPYLNAH